jgi:hypothetical protein
VIAISKRKEEIVAAAAGVTIPIKALSAENDGEAWFGLKTVRLTQPRDTPQFPVMLSAKHSGD